MFPSLLLVALRARFSQLAHGLRRWTPCRQALVLWAGVGGALAPAWAPVAAAAPASSRPNLILILADDLGYETIGANGGTSYATPVLDRLAAGGVRFTHGYAQPLCTPTRVQLMTGQYNVRNYVQFGYIEPTVVTFAQLLRQAGYATAITGKWQLGTAVDLPRRLGFDEYYLWQHTRRPPRYANPGLEYNGVPKDFQQGEYGPDLFHQQACDFITRHRERPFCLYYPLTLTHDPYQPTPDSPDWDPRLASEKEQRHERHFGEMVTYMDKLIGRLVAHVEALGLRERTLILFVGDNGTGRAATSRMGAVSVPGGKGLTTTYGMHVPLIASWPGGIARGHVCHDLVDTTDFLPTLLDAAGVPPPPSLVLDGRSFLPQLRGERGTPRAWSYGWYSPRQGANASMTVREFAFDQRYKLYRSGAFYDCQADVLEASPLAVATLTGDAAAAARKLQAALDQYRDARPVALDRQFRPEGDTGAGPEKKKGRKAAGKAQPPA